LSGSIELFSVGYSSILGDYEKCPIYGIYKDAVTILIIFLLALPVLLVLCDMLP